MNDISKLSKRLLIENIITFYFKKNQEIDDISKISKQKLIDIIIDNEIPIYTDELLKNEIKETENYTTYLEIIYHNFLKYKNINFNIINDIKNNPNLTSNDLKNIIEKYNLIIDNKIVNDLCKFKKNHLIDIITVFYFKNGHQICNINRLSKYKLINMIIDNHIPIISRKKLKKEIREKDLYTKYINIIYHNFMKYKNIDISIINNDVILTSNDLKNIIDKHNLIIENEHEIQKFNNLILDLSNAYNNYCHTSLNDNPLLEYKTIPDIIKCLQECK